MTHPLVSAFHRVEELPDVMGVGSPESREFMELLDLIDEVVASIPQVNFLVGFLCDADCQVYLIWVWPLSPACGLPPDPEPLWVVGALSGPDIK